MKRLLLMTSLLAAAAAMQAQTTAYALSVGEFKEFTVADDLNVVYKHLPDSAGMAVFSCDPSVAHAVTFSVNKEKLKIEVQTDKELTAPLPTVTIYSSQLEKVTNWGDSTVTVQSVAPTSTFKAKVIGNGYIDVSDVRATKVDAAVEAGCGRIYISGTASQAKFTIASVGAIEAASLSAQQVKCVIFGTGTVDCSPTSELSVMGAGTGKVYYTGDPRVKKRSVGVGVVKVMDNG